MAKRAPPKMKEKEHRWRIVRLRSTPAEFVGSGGSRCRESVKKVMAEYEITDPQQQKRLIAIQEP
jgi:hypothetical protein